MFTGITRGAFPVVEIRPSTDLMQLTVELPQALVEGLAIGASVAVDGTCLSVTRIQGDHVSFDIIPETLDKTTLGSLKVGDRVNIERSLRFGDEVGGHLLSGHVIGIATIERIIDSGNRYVIYFRCPQQWMRYILPKGYVAVHGGSLTVVDTDPSGLFSVHLIPETRRVNTIGKMKEGDLVNIEVDSHTQAIVDTVERYLEAQAKPCEQL